MINRSSPSPRPSPSGNSSPFMGRSRRRRRRGGTRPPIAFLRLPPIRGVYIHVERRPIAIILSPRYPGPPSGYGGGAAPAPHPPRPPAEEPPPRADPPLRH